MVHTAQFTAASNTAVTGTVIAPANQRVYLYEAITSYTAAATSASLTISGLNDGSVSWTIAAALGPTVFQFPQPLVTTAGGTLTATLSAGGSTIGTVTLVYDVL